MPCTPCSHVQGRRSSFRLLSESSSECMLSGVTQLAAGHARTSSPMPAAVLLSSAVTTHLGHLQRPLSPGHIRALCRSMPVFLFNASNHRMYGVFQAATKGRWEIKPYGSSSRSLSPTTGWAGAA